MTRKGNLKRRRSEGLAPGGTSSFPEARSRGSKGGSQGVSERTQRIYQCIITDAITMTAHHHVHYEVLFNRLFQSKVMEGVS